jgi:hypothetical protein
VDGAELGVDVSRGCGHDRMATSYASRNRCHARSMQTFRFFEADRIPREILDTAARSTPQRSTTAPAGWRRG